MPRFLIVTVLALSLALPSLASACAMRIMKVDPAVVAEAAAPAPTKEIAKAPAPESVSNAATRAVELAKAANTAEGAVTADDETVAPGPTVAATSAPALTAAMAELDSLID